MEYAPTTKQATKQKKGSNQLEPGLTNRQIGSSAKDVLPRRFPFADHAEVHQILI